MNVTPLIIPVGQHTLEGRKGGKKPTFIKESTMCYTYSHLALNFIIAL